MSWLQTFADNYPHLIYLAMFLAVIIEGDISLLLLGALSRERYVQFWEVYVIAMLAAIIHDFIFWKIGGRLSVFNKKKYLFFNFEKVTLFLDKLRPMVGLFILLSKFAWNLNRVVLVSAGYIGTEFKKFVKYSIPVALVWPLVFLSVGYVFADQTKIFEQKIGVVGLLIAAILIVVAASQLWLKKIFQKYFGMNGGKVSASIEQK
ncbi:MAG: Dolichyl-phosphate-mannose-protein mannosyltransferase [Candidatus Wolfebacteria bacterium GW2011_GWC1_43_10]|uniref:Dolichyl-phosphate-mannose-protein mannosyltransferase n=1 Tax=Candidatus Wolfebacteria bacterium GW2011_GWC1_43_10 TaxID=1619011 RepID=A0A0G1EHL0_9BACT|nr:MAG: Dolichyl-phosphate-mannose-protein mannosyltransferase [Candidatus Wolfebacteria bacterium GW2011_GWC1_43_10]KKT23121.1 MAG: Dolichyl-phosphate-mannose-protein mannosyltransferase [Parcubacteria group bacterium GW2011_GWB1_43_8b]KKT85608.1 MAG: Dolichyl-phosphate-mannose-protein mannosyltransferase [Parcubacteria group bacterium GW2011_GWA1_Parcubacteria_45_10]